MTAPSNIHEAIINVMKEVGYVQKTKTAGLNYSFAGEAALIAAIRPVLIKHDITVHAEYPNVEFGEWTTAKGYKMNTARVQGKFVFTHAPSQTSIIVDAIGEGMDAGDKAIYKAQTGAFKYALRQTFVIETGDDPDQSRPDDDEPPTPATPAEPTGFVKLVRDTWIAAKVIPPNAHPKHVMTLFNKTGFDKTVSAESLAKWGKIYRGYRDEGLDVDVAVERTKATYVAPGVEGIPDVEPAPEEYDDLFPDE